MSEISDSPLAPLEKLELLLPGFKGYKRKDLIRQDDVLVRSAIRNTLLKVQEEITAKEGEIASSNPFDPKIHDYEDLLSQLRTLTEEVWGAPTGMYLFYDRYKMFESDLEKIVEFDFKLVTLASSLLEDARSGVEPQVLKNKVKELRNTFSQRQKLFMPEKLR
ncbi:hypothetical protein B9Q13_04130 [Candidatus Marsarchaeota G2 archaeon ECH_B_SAG-G16]|jgi:hypothetical protein|uniref:Uncharacterized protein n=1 Tax=Candidatus Marsarchaeota G2 archaeon ECH_B_SAG-G16 TaxID=1978167 RepID=A0A2R6C137_9ARCH|nr:MAG: hypothetical protein B9Q13_04130 [Candidatus Marsarchaeota G2 archaeon ECH_B_SAG-G16]